MQIVLVYLEWFRRNSLLNCVSQIKKGQKNHFKHIFWGGSRSLKVIDVGTAGKLVSSAYTQQVFVYLQPFSC